MSFLCLRDLDDLLRLKLRFDDSISTFSLFFRTVEYFLILAFSRSLIKLEVGEKLIKTIGRDELGF